MAVQDLGPLDWKTPIVAGNGTPTPEFQRRWNQQRVNNTFIGGVTIGVGAPTGTPADGAEYLDTSTTPFTLYVGSAEAWHKVSPFAFTQLTDTPTSYSGAGLDLVQVKSTADGLKFSTLSSILDGAFSSAQGAVLYRGASAWAALAPGTSGDVLTTAGAGANPSWAAGGGGGGSSYEASPAVPVLSGFTLVNGGGASTSTVATGIQLVDLTSPSANLRFLQDNAGPPATPYTVKMRCTVMHSLGAGGSYPGCIAVANVAGAYIVLGRFQQSLLLQRLVSVTSPVSNIVGPTAMYAGLASHWFAISNDGTTLGFWVSEDGVNWGEIATEPLLTFIAAVSQVGIGIFANGEPTGSGFQSYQVIAGSHP